MPRRDAAGQLLVGGMGVLGYAKAEVVVGRHLDRLGTWAMGKGAAQPRAVTTAIR